MSPSSPRVVMISPMPSAGKRAPSGVAHYSEELVSAISAHAADSVVVLAQRDARATSAVLPTWREGLLAPWDLYRALRRLRPTTVHFQHELRILGGVLPGLLFIPVLWLAGRKAQVVMTIHGVVPRSEISRLLGTDGPVRGRLAYGLLRLIYRSHARFARVIIVHHKYFETILHDDYGISAGRTAVIPMGFHLPAAGPNRREPNGPVRLLVFGFLADYKRPEDLLDLMESTESEGLHLQFGAALNPRNRGPKIGARFNEMRARVDALGSRASWLGYVSDDELPSVVRSSDVVVLPYTSCIAVSGVATWALEAGVPLAYDDRIAPLLGSGAAAYSQDPRSMRSAMLAAAAGDGQGGVDSSFASWPEVASRVVKCWNNEDR